MAKSSKSAAPKAAPSELDWSKAVSPLLKKYKGKKHPLDYGSIYELIVMVVLSAQDSDKNINAVSKGLFEAFPTLKKLKQATPETLQKHISKVRNNRNKTKWLLEMAQQVKDDKNIPLTMEGLTALPGLGRKSANVILREAGQKAVGVIVDLHVVRVAPRLGIASGTDPKKIEQQIMEVLPPKSWGEIGMAMSFLGRETCRPSKPKCTECCMSGVCAYLNS